MTDWSSWTSFIVAISTAGVLSTSLSTHAANLGGNCCSDLEERIAELEATTLRKGNRKVSLSLSGFVNEAILFWDDGYESNTYIVTNNAARTRFRFKGNATINADWSAGFLLEIGMRRTNNSTAVNQFEPNVPVGMDVRHQALYLKSRTFGTFWLGHTNDSTKDLEDICLGCVLNNEVQTLWIWGGFLPHLGNGSYLNTTYSRLRVGAAPGTGTRHNLVRWISPTFAGINLHADFGDDDIWNAALRFRRDLRTFQFAGGIGYGENTQSNPRPIQRVVGSVSVAHTPTGVYAAFAAGESKNNNIAAGLDKTDDFWWTTLGVGRKWHALGKTTFYGQYGHHTGGDAGTVDVFNAQSADRTAFDTLTIRDSEYDVWSAGLNQQIDAAAMELYLAYYNVSGTLSTTTGNVSPDTFQAVFTGARIKF